MVPATDDWDPKITTFPGSYIVTVAWCHVLSALGDESCWRDDATGLAALRRVSAVLAAATVFVMHDIVTRLHRHRPGVGKAPLWLHTAMLALWPAHWFFAFLSYTDAASSFFALLMYVVCVRVCRHGNWSCCCY